MSRRHFESTENAELRAKIDEAKRRLPLPALMIKLGLAEHTKRNARCPFHHPDKKPSFSVWQANGAWFWKCHAGCGEGDEIAFLVKHFGISRREGIRRYLEMAGFPACHSKSREYPELPEPHGSPKSPKSPESPRFPVYPVSNGQGLEEELKGLAVRNACTERNTARKRRWQLLRDLRAVEVRIGRELEIPELMLALYEWYRLSQPFLDPAKTPEYYLAAFLAELRKVRVPTGEGETIDKALDRVSKLCVSGLPTIPGVADAPESWRRVLALHRELSRLCGGNTYFLSCRDAAKASPGLSHQTAYNINLILTQRGVIEIVRSGDPRPNGKASEFRYLLSQRENGAEEDDGEFEI